MSHGNLPNADKHDPSALGRELSTAVIGFHHAVADLLGLSAADHKALETVVRLGPLPASELADHARLTRSATTALIDRLERAGYVERRTDPDDRRRVLVAATVAHHPRATAASAGLARAIASTMRQFTNREQQVILHYVTATIDVLREQTRRIQG